MNLKKVLFGLAVCAFAFTFAGCGGSSSETSTPKSDKTIKIGTLAGPHEEFMEEVKKNAAKKGLTIEIVTFNDYALPNEALNSKDIDANMCQHLPYLKNQIKDRGYDLTSLGSTLLFPMGVYSDKIKSVDEIKDDMTLAIPNDPSNGGRALEILDQAGVIKLKKDIGSKATITDIAENPHHLKIQEVDATMIPRMLPDLDFAVINNSYATKSGLIPTKDAFILEKPDSPYANVVAVRTADKDRPEFKELMDIIRTPEMKQFVDEHFKGAAIATW